MSQLWPRVCSVENLRSAWEVVHHKGARGGLDRVTVEGFGLKAAVSLAALRDELLAGRYVPEPVEQVEIPKVGDPGSRRTIGMLAVRDKIAQQAVRQVVEPLFERRFSDASYGYRPRKGPTRAAARVSHHLGPLGHRWVVVADVDQFFPSVRHARLLAAVRDSVPDPSLLRLLELWLRMGAIDGSGQWTDVREGVVQGAVLSPLLANVYLHPFDLRLVAAGHGLVRYADDLVITEREERRAHQALATAVTVFGDLGLRLNEGAAVVAAAAGFDFLGVHFEGPVRGIPAKKLDEIPARLARLARLAGRDPEAALAQASALVAGWVRYYRAVVSDPALDKLDVAIERGLRPVVREASISGRTTRDGLVRALGALASARPRAASWAEGLVAGASTKRAVLRKGHEAVAVVPPATAPSPAQAVRRRKRAHVRAHADASRLVVSTPGSFVGKAGGRVVVRRERRVVLELPAQKLQSVTISASGVAVSTDVMTLCAEKRVPMLITDGRGAVAGAWVAPRPADASLVLAQVRLAADAEATLALAKRFVRGKMLNQASLVKSLAKYKRGRGDAFLAEVAPFCGALDGLLEELEAIELDPDLATARSRVMSVEGRAAQRYWRLFERALAQRADFAGREGRGATDVVNSMLNYGYAVLQGRAWLALLEAGLLPEVAFLHAAQPTKPVLAFDLMEEFRAVAVDRVVLTQIARREPAAVDATGLLTGETRSRLIRRLNERFGTLLRYRTREVSLEDALRLQARLLAAHVRGEKQYRPFAARW